MDTKRRTLASAASLSAIVANLQYATPPVSVTAPTIDTGVKPPTTGEERLEAVFQRLKGTNPFAADFKEYAARLDTGKKALPLYTTPESRAAHDMKIAASAIALGNMQGASAGSEHVKNLHVQIASRVAETAVWYQKLVEYALVMECLPEEVPYVYEGIEPQYAARFFALEIPPKNAVAMYKMIFPNTEKWYEGEDLLRLSIPPALNGKPTPRPGLKPMDITARPGRTARKPKGKRR